jgi:hypothetical protein
MVGIPASLARSARAALRPLLTHTYSRYTPESVAVLDDEDAAVLDDYGEPTFTDGPTTSGLPCAYLASRRLVQRDEGAVVLDVPTLAVYHDDALAVGDRVLDVTDNEGTVLVASATVEAFDPAAEAGASVLKVAVLRVAVGAP